MAKLISVTEESLNSHEHSPFITKLYGAHRLTTAVDDNGKARIEMESAYPDGTPSDRLVSETLTAVETALNSAEGTVNHLVYSVVGDNSSANAITPYDKAFKVIDIVEVVEDPDNAAQSVITSRTDRKSIKLELIVAETVANILAAANA